MTVPPRERTSALQRPHILIVTDDPGLKEFMSEGLTYGGFWTSSVASALQTLEVFRLRSFDLVLLDADLGGMGAMELLRRLRGRSDRARDAPRTDVPILLVTDRRDNIDPAEGAAAGLDGVLAAPIELEEVVPHLHQVVLSWRETHPGRPMADAAAQARPTDGTTSDRTPPTPA